MNLSLKSSWICFQKRMYSGDIHPVHSTHVETVVLLSREKSRLAKDYVKVGIDAEEYYRIKEDK